MPEAKGSARTPLGPIPKIVAYGCQTPSAQRRSDQKNAIYSGHLRLCQKPRAAHALRSDQFVSFLALISKEGEKQIV